MRHLKDWSPMGLALVIVLALVKLVTMPDQQKWWPCEPTCSGPPNQCPEPPCS